MRLDHIIYKAPDSRIQILQMKNLALQKGVFFFFLSSATYNGNSNTQTMRFLFSVCSLFFSFFVNLLCYWKEAPPASFLLEKVLLCRPPKSFVYPPGTQFLYLPPLKEIIRNRLKQVIQTPSRTYLNNY